MSIIPTTKQPVPGLQSSQPCLQTQPSDCGRKPYNTVWRGAVPVEAQKLTKSRTFTLLNVGKASHFTQVRQETNQRLRRLGQKQHNLKTNRPLSEVVSPGLRWIVMVEGCWWHKIIFTAKWIQQVIESSLRGCAASISKAGIRYYTAVILVSGSKSFNNNLIFFMFDARLFCIEILWLNCTFNMQNYHAIRCFFPQIKWRGLTLFCSVGTCGKVEKNMLTDANTMYLPVV